MLNQLYTSVLILNFSIVSGFLWLISTLELYFNKNTNSCIKNGIYECGFITINKNIFPISYNTILLILFSVVYEIELIVLITFIFNLNIIVGDFKLALSILFYLVLLTVWIDLNLKKLNWIN